MSYVGEEGINLPEDTNNEEIYRRLEEWEQTETGSWYEAKEQQAAGLVFERTWRSSEQ